MMHKLFKLALLFLITCTYIIKAQEEITKSCCSGPKTGVYKSIYAQDLTVTGKALFRGNVDVGGTITAGAVAARGSLTINNKNVVSAGSEALTDLRFSFIFPDDLSLTITADNSSGSYVFNATVPDNTLITRVRGFGVTQSSLLIVSAINLAASGFSLLYSNPDVGSITIADGNLTHPIDTACAITIIFSFVGKFTNPFSDSNFNAPTINMAFERLGSFYSNDGIILNVTPYVNNVTNQEFTANIAITAIGKEVSTAANVTALANAISQFISNSYVNFIVQGA